MPKNQNTAGKRARAAARQGAKYTAALREQEAGRAQPVPLQEDLADPTGVDVVAYARLLLDRLRTRRPEAARPDCRHPWEFTRALDAAMAAGLDLVDQVAADDVDQAAVERVVSGTKSGPTHGRISAPVSDLDVLDQERVLAPPGAGHPSTHRKPGENGWTWIGRSGASFCWRRWGLCGAVPALARLRTRACDGAAVTGIEHPCVLEGLH